MKSCKISTAHLRFSCLKVYLRNFLFSQEILTNICHQISQALGSSLLTKNMKICGKENILWKLFVLIHMTCIIIFLLSVVNVTMSLFPFFHSFPVTSWQISHQKLRITTKIESNSLHHPQFTFDFSIFPFPLTRWKRKHVFFFWFC